jgi:DNA repair exonuclease SbcCD nuclease subunit
LKVLVSADYHIKLNTKNIPVDWAKNRFRLLFEKIHGFNGKVDMHIMCGDWFDKMPTLEELELYYEFVAGCRVETLIIPGNHESLKKETTFFTFLKSITSRINHLVRVIDEVETYKGIDFIPYNRLKQYEKDPSFFQPSSNILVTHVRGEIPPHVKPEVNLDILDRWKVVLAGDLHSYDNCQRNILYPGSPITTSFHRSKVDTGVIILDTVTLDHRFTKLDLPQLIRKTIKVGEAMEPTSPDHTIYEIEGDMAELANLEDNVLMDKKVTKRNNDTALILSPEMTIEQEVQEYLSYILELPQDTVDKVLKTYHDHSKNFTL